MGHEISGTGDMSREPNYPAGGNAGFGVEFAFERHWPGVPHPGCSGFWAAVLPTPARSLPGTLCGRSGNMSRLAVLEPARSRLLNTAGVAGLEPATYGFGDRRSTN